VTPFSSPQIIIAPFVLVVGISMAKKALEDRHRFVLVHFLSISSFEIFVFSSDYVKKILE